MSTPVPPAARSPRWQLGLALLSFLAASFFGARAGVDFERWVVASLWIVVGLIWIVLWRMDVKKRERAIERAQGNGAPVEGPRGGETDQPADDLTDGPGAVDRPAPGRASAD